MRNDLFDAFQITVFGIFYFVFTLMGIYGLFNDWDEGAIALKLVIGLGCGIQVDRVLDKHK